MKKKLISVGALFVFVGFLFGIIYRGPGNKEYAKLLFGIDLNKYQVISIQNTLDPFRYDGKFVVELEVEEEQMDMLLSELEAELGPLDEHYDQVGVPFKREILIDTPKPYRACTVIVKYPKPVDGVYEVKLSYID